MDIFHQRPFRVAIVITRDLSEHNGRTPILTHIVRALSARYEIELLHLPALVESRSIRDTAGALLIGIASVFRGRPMPLQCLLYASPRQCKATAARIAEKSCNAVYLDTVRCQQLLRTLRRSQPDLHIVTDFDDLMSRRARYLYQMRLPFATGHVSRHVPRWLSFLSEKLLSRPIAAYETLTLPAAEDEVIAASNSTILISGADREQLGIRTRIGTVRAIPPAIAVVRPPLEGIPLRRFIFIGSDNFIHNRAAIDFLLETWRQVRPALALHIYGQQCRSEKAVAGVHWHGFVDDLAEVYKPGSIALAPAMDRGGIKTKVLEAWAWGCPVLCNKAALEGLAVESYPFVLPEAKWPALLVAPHDHDWENAARIGYAFVRDYCSVERFEQAWRDILNPGESKSMAIAADLTKTGRHAPSKTEPELISIPARAQAGG